MIRCRMLFVLALILACAPARAQAPELPEFARPYASDTPTSVELYPRLAPGHVVTPGDQGWPLGPARDRDLDVVVLADAVERAPSGAESFRVDYRIPAPGPAAAKAPGQPGGVSGALACLRGAARLDASKTRGLEFAIRGAHPALAVVVIDASNADDPRRVDRFFGVFSVGQTWKTVRIAFRSMAVATGWREPGRAGLLPGDGVLRPDRIEAIRIGIDPGRAQPGPGSFWVGDLTFFR